jgi:hypothetical protein
MLAVAVSHRHGRYGMRAALFGDAQDLVVYGGFANVDGSGLSNTDREGLGDIWVYRFGTRAWERKRSLPIADDLGGNEGYGSSAVVGSTMIVFGARRMLRRSQPVYSNSYAQFSVDSGAYEFLPPISGPSPVFPSARTGQPVCPPCGPTCRFALLYREASRIRPPASAVLPLCASAARLQGCATARMCAARHAQQRLPRRAGATLVVLTSQVALMFGGVGAQGALNDVWALPLTPVCKISDKTRKKYALHCTALHCMLSGWRASGVRLIATGH